MNPIILSVLNLIRGQIDEVFPLFDFDTSLILDKIVEIQSSIATLSIQDAPIASAHVILLAAGVVIFLGVAGESFFKKTGIPDVAFLMIFGVIIGPVLGIIQPEAVIEVVPYFAALAFLTKLLRYKILYRHYLFRMHQLLRLMLYYLQQE